MLMRRRMKINKEEKRKKNVTRAGGRKNREKG